MRSRICGFIASKQRLTPRAWIQPIGGLGWICWQSHDHDLSLETADIAAVRRQTTDQKPSALGCMPVNQPSHARLPEVLAGMHYAAFAILMLGQLLRVFKGA